GPASSPTPRSTRSARACRSSSQKSPEHGRSTRWRSSSTHGRCIMNDEPASATILRKMRARKAAEQSDTARRAGRRSADNGPDTPPTPLAFVNINAWTGRTPPEREWAVRDRFPLRNVALLSGEGSTGKSILLMQLGAAHVLAKDLVQT